VVEGEGHIRSISKEDVSRFFSKTVEGLKQVRDINHSINEHMIDVVNFNTATLPSKMYEYDIRSGEKNLRKYISGKNVVIRNRKWGLNVL
jgi:enolase